MSMVVQISDPHVWRRGEHLYGELDTASFLAAAIRRVNELPQQPDLVVVSGDLVNDGTEHEYEHARSLFDELDAPWRAIVGNHDDAVVAASVLGGGNNLFAPMDYRWATPASGVVDLQDVRIVGLNSSRPGQSFGTIDPRDLDAARVALADRGDVAGVIAVHHPPVQVGLAAMDALKLDRASSQALGAVVAEQRVCAVWCGHLHRATFTLWNGAMVTTSPSTAHAIASDFRSDAPLTVSDEPPGMLIHCFGKGSLTTHVAAIGEFTSTVVEDAPPGLSEEQI